MGSCRAGAPPRLVPANASPLCFERRASHVERAASADEVAFGLYLPCAEMMLAASGGSALEGQRPMLFQHLDRLGDDDLLLMDRGYPSHWLVAVLNGRGIDFCMRVEKAGNSGFACVRDLLRRKRPARRGAAVDKAHHRAAAHSILKQLLPALLLGAVVATRLVEPLISIAGPTYSHRPSIIKSKPRATRPKTHKPTSLNPC